MSTGGTFDCVHLVVVVARLFAPEVIAVVAAPIPPFSFVVAPKASVVGTSAVVVSPAARFVGFPGRLL